MVMLNANSGAPVQTADDLAVNVKQIIWSHGDDQKYKLNLWCAGPVLADPAVPGGFRFAIQGDCGLYDVVIRPNPDRRLV